MLISENKESFRNHLIQFASHIDYSNNAKEDKSVYQIADSYVKNQISMEDGMKAWADYENECFRKNKRLLKAIKSIKGKTFYKYLSGIIEGSEGIKGIAEIVKEPTGKFQKDNYGRQIKGIWVQQWSVGMEGDSWEGYVCVEIKPNKYFKFSYSM